MALFNWMNVGNFPWQYLCRLVTAAASRGALIVVVIYYSPIHFVYSDGRLRCNSRPSTYVACGAQKRRQWLVRQFHNIVPPWFTCLPLRRLSSTVPCSLIFGNVSWRLTRPNHDNLLSILLQHLFSNALIRVSRSAVSVQLSHPKSCIDKTSEL